MTARYLSFGVCLSIAIVPQFGCKYVARKIAEKTIEKSTGAQNVSLDDKGGVRATNAKGEHVQLGGGATLPEEWPSFLPLYKDAKVLGSTSAGKKKTAILEVTATPDEVVRFYENALKGAGYGDKQLVQFGPTRALTMKNGASQANVAVIAQNTEKISVTIAFE